MILGIGTDLLEVSRMERELKAGGRAFRDRLFTRAESSYCSGKRYPSRHFAARFAAKEALFKALPAGEEESPRWKEVEVTLDSDGRPGLVLHGATRRAAERLHVSAIFLSLSHTSLVAAANVVLER